MSIIHLPDIPMYWGQFKQNNRLNLFTARMGDYMAMHRHTNLERCLCLYTKEERDSAPENTGTLYKFKWVQDYFANKWEMLYYPQKNVAIDERMVFWRGRSKLTQYNKQKPTKWGFKVIVLLYFVLDKSHLKTFF